MKTTILFTAILLLFTTTALQAQELTPFQDANEKYGFKDAKGNIVVQPKYDDVDGFFEDMAAVNVGGTSYALPHGGSYVRGGKWGFIDKTGKETIKPQYDNVYGFSEGMASVNVGAKLNSTTMAMTGGKWGFIDKTGRVVVEPKYDNAGSFSEGLADVSQNYKFGFIDKMGKEIIEPQFDEVGSFSEGMAYMRKGDKYGFIDKTGKIVVAPKYDNASPFSEGLAAVKQSYKWGFIDKTGKVVIELQYGNNSGFREGVAPVSLNGKHGYIDKTGKAVIPLQYEGGDYFYNGMAAVKKNGKWGFINKTGKFIIEPQYDFAGDFKGGTARVKLNGREFYIDKTGKEIGSNPQSATTNANTKPTSSTNSTTLSPNFYNQFKTILNTDWESLKGEGLDEDRYSSGVSIYYQSKKKLDGFELTVEYEENKEGNTTYFDKYVYGENKPNPGNAQLFEKIKTELTKLEKEGFKLQNGKNSFDIVSGQQAEGLLSRVSLDENRINIRFFKSFILKTVYSNGDVYEGDFRGTTGKTVKGKYTWANGDVYEGDFVGDKRTGKGKYIWINGNVYIGDFVDGKFNGKGKLTQNGKVYEGDFKDGKFLGSAKPSVPADITIPESTLKEDPATTDLPVVPDKLSPGFFDQCKAIFNTDWESLKGKEIGILSYADYYQVYYECTKPLTGFKVIAFKRINKWGTYYFVIATVQEKEKAKAFYSQINDELSRLKNDGYIMDATQSDKHQGFGINKNGHSFGNAYLNNEGFISITFNHSVIAENGQKLK